MVNPEVPSSNFYALLIGIDFYRENSRYESLKGAVRDINLVAEYLDKTLKVPAERLFKLTASNPGVSSIVEPETALPTYANIVGAFDAITREAAEGAQVYIHYSGHGGRVKTSYPEQKGADQPDEGIVPMDYGSGGRYLLDVELALLLKRMRL
jgi:Caspase domain